MNNKIEFIASAISDTQGTIRATDVKVGVLLAGMLLPISLAGKIWAHFFKFSSLFPPWIAIIVGFIFCLMWLVSIICLVRTISAIANPSTHIVNADGFRGSFYGSGLYQFNFLDALFNRSIIKANKDVLKFSNEYPEDENSIISELAFEHMKLIYIRDIKLHRLDFALKTGSAWFIIGITIYIISKFS